MKKMLYLLTGVVCTGYFIAHDFNNRRKFTPSRIVFDITVGLLWWPIFFLIALEETLKAMGFLSGQFNFSNKGERHD